jgi:SAM-dependent methyltransferase
VRLIQADAQSLDLPSGSAHAVFSRFGVMNFNDPVAAFANFRRILRPSGALSFSCWRSLQDNELDYFPLSAVGVQAEVDNSPFSFADPEHIRSTLEAAGFYPIARRKGVERRSRRDDFCAYESWTARKDRPRESHPASNRPASIA